MIIRRTKRNRSVYLCCFVASLCVTVALQLLWDCNIDSHVKSQEKCSREQWKSKKEQVEKAAKKVKRAKRESE